MTPLPNIPTDNLYKFMFIGGLTLILSSFLIFITQYNNIKEKIDKVDLEIVESESDIDFLEEDSDELKVEISKVKTNLDKLNLDTVDLIKQFNSLRENLGDKDYRDYLSFVYEHKKDIIPYYKENEILNKKTEEYTTKQRQLSKNIKIRSLKIKQLSKESHSLIVLSILTTILIIIGYIMTKHGLKNWYNLVQKPTDEKIKLELQELKNKTGT